MKILYCSPLLAYEGHFAHETGAKSVVMADAGLTGQIVNVRVQGADTNSLSAVLA